MEAINLEANDTTYLLSIDKNAIDKEALLDLIERIRLEYLIKKNDFDKDIEEVKEAEFSGITVEEINQEIHTQRQKFTKATKEKNLQDLKDFIKNQAAKVDKIEFMTREEIHTR